VVLGELSLSKPGDLPRLNPNQGAKLVGLSGHLGSGKTAFTKLVAKNLGVNETVTSPTFVIMKIYPINAGEVNYRFHRLIHIDAYRLEKPEELEALNFEQIMSDSKNLVLIEWPENVGLKEFDYGCHLKFAIVDGKHTISVE
jgi:tRNA threonylcarbamoyl adenosine modification protein YjeE